jgi:hypothetical protein
MGKGGPTPIIIVIAVLVVGILLFAVWRKTFTPEGSRPPAPVQLPQGMNRGTPRSTTRADQ